MAKARKSGSSGKSRGTVAIIVLLLVASAGIRLSTSAGSVLAEVQRTTELPAPPDAVAETRMEPPSKEEMRSIVQAFEARETRIREQEAEIAQRMEKLEAADRKLRERLDELRAAEEELRATLSLASTAAEDDLTRLTAVYENMKPKTAAALFQEMAPEFAAGFLGRMRPDSAAAVMAGMTPESAYSVSAILAGRNANAPQK